MNKFFTVFKFEFLSSVKNKTFIVSTVIIIIGILIGVNIPLFVNVFKTITGDKDSNKDDKKAIFYIEEGDYHIDDIESKFPQFKWTETKNIEDLTKLVENEQYKVGLQLGKFNYKITNKSSNMIPAISERDLVELMRMFNQKDLLVDKNFNQNEINAFYDDNIKGEFVFLGKDIGQTFWIGYVFVMLLYMSIIMYGQTILTSVVTEKSTKTMEILITSVDTKHLIFGKVLGAVSMALMQMLIYFGTALLGLIITKKYWMEFSPGIFEILNMTFNAKIMVVSLIFFLLGFFVYSFMYAGFGSTVSRMEDAGSVAALPMILIMIAFFIAILNAANPDTTFVKIASFIPFLSPFVMLMRFCVTDVTFIELIIAIIINIITILVSGFFSAKLYKAGVLMYGKPPSLKETLKVIFAKG